MSKDIIDRFIAEFLSGKVDRITKGLNYDFAKIARKYTDRSGQHYFTVTPDNIKSIIITGIARNLYPTFLAQAKERKNAANKEIRARNRGKDPKDKEALVILEDRQTLIQQAKEKAFTDYFDKDDAFFESIFKEVSKELMEKKYSIASTPNSINVLAKDRASGDDIKNIIFQKFKDKLPRAKKELNEKLNEEVLSIDKQTRTLLDLIFTETHFLHTGGTTVGQSQAAILKSNPMMDTFSAETIEFPTDNKNKFIQIKNPFSNKASRDAAAELLTEAIGQVVQKKLINFSWESIDGTTERKIVVRDDSGGISKIIGEFNSRELNAAGAEQFDWKKLYPDIQQAFLKRLKESADGEVNSLATDQGSQPFSDRLLGSIVNEALKTLTKSKKVKVKKLKQEKPKSNYKAKVKKANKAYKPTKKTVRASKVSIPRPTIKPTTTVTNKVTRVKPDTTLNLNALKAQINARLSMTVIKNMGTPALENRTGRFARSVQVTDVIQTAKGFPSIGYDYQKYPYQTFEPGYAQGSAQRDPRTLIDRSIREIASELIVGRFYTRRV